MGGQSDVESKGLPGPERPAAPLPTQPLASPLAGGGGGGRCHVGDVQATNIAPAEPESPDRNNAPFCPDGDRGHCVCRLQTDTRSTVRPSERQGCLGQPLWPEAAAPNVTTNSEQANGPPLSQNGAPLRLQALRPKGPRVEIGNRNFGANWIIRS